MVYSDNAADGHNTTVRPLRTVNGKTTTADLFYNFTTYYTLLPVEKVKITSSGSYISFRVLLRLLKLRFRRIALWVTVGEADWSDAYCGIFPIQYVIRVFFAYCNFDIYSHTAYCILHFGRISTHC